MEFGLIRENGDLRLYGAGIVSSYGESIFALEDPSPNRVGFDLQRTMRTNYRIDDYQQTYFVIDSFEDLLRQTLETDFALLYAELEQRSPTSRPTRCWPATACSIAAPRPAPAPRPDRT